MSQHDESDNEQDLRLEINLALDQLRDWFGSATLSVSPTYWLLTDGTLSLNWHVVVYLDDCAPTELPHSFGKSTLAEALADIKQQRNRFLDAEQINAELWKASLEQASNFTLENCYV